MSEVINNKSKSRYELVADGHLSIADYYKKEGMIAITHVEVPSSLRGKGVAAKLMAGVVADAKVQNLVIHPICSYAAAYLQRNPA